MVHILWYIVSPCISSPSAKILPNPKSLNNLQYVLHGFNVVSPSMLVLLQRQNYVNYVVPNGFSTFFFDVD